MKRQHRQHGRRKPSDDTAPNTGAAASALDMVLADHPGQSSALSEPITTNAIPGTLQGPGYEHVVSERRMISRMEIGWIAFFVLVLIGGSIYSGLNFTFDQAVSWFKGGQP